MLITVNNDVSVLTRDALMTELRDRLSAEWADALDSWLGERIERWIDGTRHEAFTCLPGAGMSTAEFLREANWLWEEHTRDSRRLALTIGEGPTSVTLVPEGKIQHWHELARVRR